MGADSRTEMLSLRNSGVAKRQQGDTFLFVRIGACNQPYAGFGFAWIVREVRSWPGHLPRHGEIRNIHWERYRSRKDLKMTKVELYSVVVPNKPGKGARLLTTFKEAGVNFVAIWGYPVGKNKCTIDLVAEDAAILKKAAKQLKIKL